MVPPKGAYRALLAGTQYADVRLALTSQPMSGVIVRRDLISGVVETLRSVGGEIAEHYINMVTTGASVPVIVAPAPDRYWAPGELFLRS